jgi:flavin-dependent dehydrogenase
LAEKRKKVGMCIYEEYHLNSNTMDRYFGEKRICYIYMKPQGIAGYGWVFPKKEHVNIGIGEVKPEEGHTKNLKKIFKDYIKTLKESKIIPNDLEIQKIKGGIIPLSPLGKTYSNRLILCGDAAGFINPMSGEGIYYAMSSGEIAANVISDSLENDDTSEKFLSQYQNTWKKDFGRDISLLLRSNKQWTKGPKNFVKLASKDKKLAEIALGILQGELSINEYKWKLISRYLYAKFKDKFSKK